MVNLGRCLVYLLTRHERVAVAGIGSFKRIFTPARFDAQTDRLHASQFDVRFYEDAGGGDGAELVVHYISAQRRIPHEESVVIYRKSVAALLKTLDTHGVIKLDGLGTLTQDEEQLVFVADEKEAWLTPTPVTELPLLDRKTVDSTLVEDPVDRSNASESTLHPIEEENKTSGRKFWNVAAAILLVIGLLFAGLGVYQPERVAKLSRFLVGDLTMNQASSVDPESERSQLGLEDAKTRLSVVEPDTFMDEMVADTSEVLNEIEPVSTEPVSTEPTVRFEIIVASFKTMEQAHEFVADMKQKGVNLRAIDSRMPGNRKKVSYGGFATKKEAYRELPNVQRTVEPTAWVDRIVR